MIHLASLEAGARMSSKCLSRAIGSPEPFLTKVMQSLVASHLAVSRRGKAGGFELAKDPATITMLDVVEAVEGPLILADCTQSDPANVDLCPRLSRCGAHSVWVEAQAGLRRTLSEAHLDELAENTRFHQRPISIMDLSRQEKNQHA